MFSNQKILPSFVNIFDIVSLFAAELEEPKIGISGKGLTLYHTFTTYGKGLTKIVEQGKNGGIQQT